MIKILNHLNILSEYKMLSIEDNSMLM